MARNWESLSPDYRGRLERKGISRSEYESGASLAGARGHAATPERPERAEQHPEKYEAYLFTRDELVQEILDFKRELYGGSRKWDEDKALKLAGHKANGNLRSMASLRRIADVLSRTHNLEEFLEDDSITEDDASAIYYH